MTTLTFNGVEVKLIFLMAAPDLSFASIAARRAALVKEQDEIDASNARSAVEQLLLGVYNNADKCEIDANGCWYVLKEYCGYNWATLADNFRRHMHLEMAKYGWNIDGLAHDGRLCLTQKL